MQAWGESTTPRQPRKCQYCHIRGRTGLGSPLGHGLLPSDKSNSPECQWNLITSGLLMSSGGCCFQCSKKKITKISSPDTQAPLTDVIPCKRSEKMEMLQNNKQRKESTYPNPLTQMALEGQCGLTCLNSFCSQSNATALGWRREKEKSIINAAWPCSWFSQRTRPFNGGGKMARG